MRTRARPRNRLCVGLAKTPGAARGETLEAAAFVFPVAVADIAVVRVALPDEEVVAAGTHGTILHVDERKIAQDRIVGRQRAGGGRRPIVLPAMAGRAAMRMLGARLQLGRYDELRFRSHLTSMMSVVAAIASQV